MAIPITPPRTIPAIAPADKVEGVGDCGELLGAELAEGVVCDGADEGVGEVVSDCVKDSKVEGVEAAELDGAVEERVVAKDAAGVGFGTEAIPC
jgi:hypothetical protein